MRQPWTPTPDGQLESELQAALARPRATRVTPPRPVELIGVKKVTGWLWGRMKTDAGAWLGLATLHRGRSFEGAELGWHPAEQLRVLD
jgi:hypothetical protein